MYIVFGVDRGGETGGHKVIRNGQTETRVMRHLVLRIRGILIVQWDDEVLSQGIILKGLC